jgi:hypothetical protein
MPRATYASALDGGTTARTVVGDVVVVVCVVGDVGEEVVAVVVGVVVGGYIVGNVIVGVQVPVILQQQLFAGFERSHGVIISSVACSGITVG